MHPNIFRIRNFECQSLLLNAISFNIDSINVFMVEIVIALHRAATLNIT